MGACVLLLHELSDGDSHYDWLIDPREPGVPPRSAGGEPGRTPANHPPPPEAEATHPDERALIAFRLSDRIDLALPPRFEARRLGDHRRLYLTYEGPISGGRGRVRRLASGWMRVQRQSPGVLALAGQLGEARGRLSGAVSTGDRWIFSTEATDRLAPGAGFW